MSYVFLFITIFFFSTLEVTGKFISGGISPFAITIYRFLLGGLLILPFAISEIKKNKTKFRFTDFMKLSYPGIVNVTISMMLLQLAIYYGKASLTAIIVSSNPIFVAIFARIILKEKMNISRIFGIVAGLIGVVLIISAESDVQTISRNPNLGIIFACLASIIFAFYTVISKKYVKKYGNLTTNTIAFFMGSIVLAIISVIFGMKLTFEPSLKNLLAIGYLGIFVSGIAYILFFEGLKKVPTAVGSMFFFLKPVIASILAYLIFRERINGIQIFGILVIIAGINIENIKNFIKKKDTILD